MTFSITINVDSWVLIVWSISSLAWFTECARRRSVWGHWRAPCTATRNGFGVAMSFPKHYREAAIFARIATMHLPTMTWSILRPICFALGTFRRRDRSDMPIVQSGLLGEG